MTNIEKVESHVLFSVDANELIDEDTLIKKVRFFAGLYPLTEDEIKIAVAELEEKIPVKQDRGYCLKDKNHKPWYKEAKENLPNTLWDRYRLYLTKDKGYNSNVVESINLATDEIMDLVEDPRSTNPFARRGLVIGDVQSGKTSNYLALMNKAADAGYHIFILLTGTIEKLRKQTQERVDQGFVGLDSNALKEENKNVLIGVGNVNSDISGWAVTSTGSDFTAAAAANLSGRLGDISAPIVFVVKKNKSVLEKMENWLKKYNANKATGKIDLPMLMIDDEADNASVNTKGKDDATAINKCIRRTLKLFSKSTYVGYTATPYANIFIDPVSEADMLGDDLFPRDFIYVLNNSDDYIGAQSIFPKDGKYHDCLKPNDDCENFLPLKHKKTAVPKEFPNSLKEAIASFFIVNAIRDLRGDVTKHRTMMINISIYIDVQKKLASKVRRYVKEITTEIENYYLMGEEALRYAQIAFIKSVFDKYYTGRKIHKSDDDFITWSMVQEALYPAIKDIKIEAINGGNAAKLLCYDRHEDDGLRIIAIGGYSLSRGLTLEGLCVSYFYRNTKMYDTLMQMGRWFGYRFKYTDLCQVWINRDAVEWYSYISTAAEDLKKQVRQMIEEDRTPKDFGLAVRADEAALRVTAVNKMRTAKAHKIVVSLSGNMVETPYLSAIDSIAKNNLDAINKMVENIAKAGISIGLRPNDDYYTDKFKAVDVDKEIIVAFLKMYNSHSLNFKCQTSRIVEQINKTDNSSLDKWDIIFVSGDGTIPFTINGHKLGCVYRNYDIKSAGGNEVYQISGAHAMLGTGDSYAKTGLTKIMASTIEQAERAKNEALGIEYTGSNRNTYFHIKGTGVRRNPLLVVYPVQLRHIQDPDNYEENARYADVESKVCIPQIGIAVGIPDAGQETIEYKYQINLVYYQELMGIDPSAPAETDDTIGE